MKKWISRAAAAVLKAATPDESELDAVYCWMSAFVAETAPAGGYGCTIAPFVHGCHRLVLVIAQNDDDSDECLVRTAREYESHRGLAYLPAVDWTKGPTPVS